MLDPSGGPRGEAAVSFEMDMAKTMYSATLHQASACQTSVNPMHDIGEKFAWVGSSSLDFH